MMINQLQDKVQENAQPLITVAMPIYNAGKYLRLAVLSIVEQTYQNWELLIIDDGSTDSALDSVSDIHDSRIKVISDGANKGLAARLNEAIDLANGQYLARMDQDDISLPERFKIQVEALEANVKLDLVATRALTINGENKIVGQLPFESGHQNICAKPWRGFYLPHPTWLGKIEWFRKYKYAQPAPYLCEDQELLLRAYKHSQFSCIDDVLFQYRVRETINLDKLFKTRLAVLKCQLNTFDWYEFIYKSLALIVCALRITKDIFRKIFELLR